MSHVFRFFVQPGALAVGEVSLTDEEAHQEWVSGYPKPLTVAGPRRILTDFRLPIHVFCATGRTCAGGHPARKQGTYKEG